MGTPLPLADTAPDVRPDEGSTRALADLVRLLARQAAAEHHRITRLKD